MFTSLHYYLARSKLALLLWTRELQKRLSAENSSIISLSLHPGTVHTEGLQKYISQASGIRRLLTNLFSYFFLTPSQGAVAPTFAATAPIVRAEADKYKGSYLTETGNFNKVPATGKNDALAKELCDTSEELLKKIGV